MKNVVVISTSLRSRSNSDALAEEFMRGAAESGNKVEKISLMGKDIHFCIGCFSCQTTQKCCINDDVDAIMRKIMRADVVCFATPVYYYCMSGQMKVLLDRCNPMFPSDYAFREIYLLMSADDNDPQTPQGTITGLKGWIKCYKKCSLCGTVFAGGVEGAGEIEGHPALKEAYELGLSVG